jgi:para-nitrobenzyl esterase
MKINKNKIYLTLLTAILFFTGCNSTKLNPYVPFDSNEIEMTDIVQTSIGKIRGIKNTDSTVELFAGVPYAKAPVGDLRWKEPESLEPMEGVFNADHFAPMAMQKKNSFIFNVISKTVMHSDGDRTDKAKASEDCLYLNIWKPADAKTGDNLPVLVYIHGGSLTGGQSWYESYDGENFAKKGVVFVTIAYRLGIFGFFTSDELAEESPNHTSGNYGLLDQIKALEWINDNIENFGGNKNNITIAGESAGSSSVNALCASPLAKGLFRRAIGESSSLTVPVPAHTFRSRENALEVSQKIMKEYGASSIEEMRAIPAEKLLKTKHLNNAFTVDPYSMPEYPWNIYQKGENNEEALLNGFNLREGDLFILATRVTKNNLYKLVDDSPYVTDPEAVCKLRPVAKRSDARKLYADLFSAICFTYPHYSWTKTLAGQGKNVYEYVFTKDNKGLSTYHSGELVYAYGNLGSNSIYDESDHELSETMMSYWINFARWGDPNGDKTSSDYGKLLPYWPVSYSSENPDGKVMEFGLNIGMIEDPFMEFYQYLNFDILEDDRPVTYGQKED